MNIQEREELDYVPQSELMNAYQQSRMEAELTDHRIAEAISRGKFVVGYATIAYCPSTDATIGERECFVSEHDTEAQAQAEADKHEDFDELWFFVRGPLPIYRFAINGGDVNDSEIPF